MSIEAFIWRYERGEIVATPLDEILRVFHSYADSFDEVTGVLHVQFDSAGNSCDIYLGAKAAASGATPGIMISRPLHDPRLWDCVLEIMRSGNVILFFSDDTTPLYATAGAPAHFPQDLIQSLGEPKLVASAQDILKSHET